MVTVRDKARSNRLTALLLVDNPTASQFAADDVVDISSLASKLLGNTKRPIDLWLASRPSTRDALAHYQGSSSGPELLATALIKDLNTAILGPSIYDAQRFSGVALRWETEQLLTKDPQADNLLRFNRLLIEDAYPTDVLRNQCPFEPLASFLEEKSASLAAEENYCRGAGLLIDFICAKAEQFMSKDKRRQLFNSFAHGLRYGTIEHGDDPSGLWWQPRNMTAVAPLLQGVCEFSDWCVLNRGATALNPHRRATFAEQIAFWRRWNTFKHSALLGHIKSAAAASSQAQSRQTFPSPDRPLPTRDRPPYFPHDRVFELLTRGFVHPGKQDSLLPWLKYNIRDMLVTTLLQGGALRVSEPFHIWVTDVYQDPHDRDAAFVRVYHPTDGIIEYADPITGIQVQTNRAHYLQQQHNLLPLNRRGTSGWKANLLETKGKFMPVYWYPHEYGQIFLALFNLYMFHVRPVGVTHPWLFVTENGLPLTPRAYTKLHAAAVRRIDMNPRKEAGTTPHGHRHSCAQLLQDAVDAGLISNKIMQLVLHHGSIHSQKPYTERECWKINQTMRAAEPSLADLQSTKSALADLCRMFRD
jgi:hypothetical protein